MKNAPLLIALLLILPCQEAKAVETHSMETGCYWGFPQGAEPAENSGAFYMDRWSDRGYINLAGFTMSWAQMNPADGVYDFAPLQTLLDQAGSNKTPLIIRLKCHVSDRGTPADWGGPDLPYIPQWVIDKHQPPQFFTMGDGTGQSYIRVVAPWNSGVQQELQAFIAEFGRQDLFSNPSLRGIYITGFSSGYGEEFWLHRNYLQNALQAGMTEALVLDTYKDRIDWWVAAAGENVSKLIWIDFGEIQQTGYDRDSLDSYAMGLGLGWRHGGPDTYHSPLPTDIGQSYDAASGYITTDWSFGLRDGKRIFGGEIEVVFRSSNPGMTEEEQIHLTESAIMRTAQIGMNYAWTNPDFVDYGPEMFQWYLKAGGWRPGNSPDAVCWLREDYFRMNGQDCVWKNFERFLLQREYPGAGTQPVLPVSRPAHIFWQDPSGRHYDYTARSTRVADGDTVMLFFLQEDFKNTLQAPFTVTAAYFDNSGSEWVLEVPANLGYDASPPVQGLNDKAWKTALFKVNGLPDNTSSQENCDFRIRVLNNQDVSIKFVRVIRNAEPSQIRLQPLPSAGNWRVKVLPGELIFTFPAKSDFRITIGSVAGTITRYTVRQSHKASISLKRYEPGIYIIGISDGVKRYCKKIYMLE